MKPLWLPDPWFPIDSVMEVTGIDANAGITSSGWATANEAMYIPVRPPQDVVLYALRTCGDNASNNYDMGVYLADGTRYASKGSTAVANAILELTFADLRVRAGELIYAAFTYSGTSARQWQYSTVDDGLKAVCMAEASALPLPASMGTLIQPTVSHLPCFCFGVR